MLPVIFGCAGTALTRDEAAFFADANPFGFILFRRNCDTPEQVRALVDALRRAVGRSSAPVLIDQEGGRVARLRPPHWPLMPPMRPIGALYERNRDAGLEAMRLHATRTAAMLADLGISVNCAPVCDLAVDGATDALGDRVFSRDPQTVIALARAAMEAYLSAGVLPVIKHMPGHGRATVDPHTTLPTVTADRATLEASDWVPFRALADAPLGMNCHVVFTALDPAAPVSMSSVVNRAILREALGFKGLLLSDDLDMGALSGSPADRARQAIAAGADIALHCPGTLQDMQAIAGVLPPVSEDALQRWDRASAMLRSSPPRDPQADEVRLRELLDLSV